MSHPFVLPPLRNWQDFEDLCLDLWRRLWNDPDAQKNGRTGQPQAGVDVFGRPDGGREWAGVQCKRFEESLTPKVVAEEVAKARTFEPALSRYVIATIAPSDVHCQKEARKITDDGFPVTVVSWEEICHHLKEHPYLVERYFGIPAAQGKGGDASAESRGIAVAGDVKDSFFITGGQVTINQGRASVEPPLTGYRCMANRPEGFVERQELDEIREKLCASNAPTVGITTALRGAGGFGKTTLAQALCYDERIRAAYPDGILWTTIGDRASEADRLSRVLDLIRWWIRSDPPHFDSVPAAAAYLREILSGLRVLVVVDDAWSPADVEPFRGAGAGLLVTTRMRETLPAGCEPVDVDAMRLGEAVDLLAAGLAAIDGLRSRFENLAKKLGEWPLLLKLANGTLRELVSAGLDFPEALDEVEGSLSDAGLEAFDQKDSGQRERAVNHTVRVSLQRLSEEERRKYEALAIFPEDEDVPLAIVERLWSCSAPAARQLALRLHRLSLLRDLDLADGTLRLHDVFRKYLIDCQEEAAAALHRDFLARCQQQSGNWADLPTSESYLWRWLPYHLVHAGQSETLCDLLMNFRFLGLRLHATDVNVVIADFNPFSELPDLHTIQSTLRTCADILDRYPEQLAGQLLGRLPERTEEGGIRTWERLRQEVGAAGKEFFPNGAGLLPRRASLLPAGDPLRPTVEGLTDWMRTIERRGPAVHAVAAVGEGWALSGSADGLLRLWDLATGACRRTFAGYISSVSAVTSAGEGRALSGSADGLLRLWDLATGACLRAFKGHAGTVHAVAFVGEGRALSGSADSTLRLWDLATGTCLRTFVGHTDGVHAAASAGEGRALSGSADGKLRLWDLTTGTCLRTFEGHTSSSLGGAPSLLDLVTPAWMRTIERPGRAVHAVTAGEGWALSGSADGTLRLWDLATGACWRTFEGHTGGVRAVASAGERLALSGSYDRTLRLWDLATGDCLAVFTFDHPVRAIAVVNRIVIVGDAGGNVHFLDLILPP